MILIVMIMCTGEPELECHQDVMVMKDDWPDGELDVAHYQLISMLLIN